MDDVKVKNKGGRPAFVASDEQRYSVELMSGIGIQHAVMARALGIDTKTLQKHFREELDNGKTKTICRVADSIVRQALAGNMTAAIFYLKCHAGWRDRDAMDTVGKKEVAAREAQTAHEGSEWGSLLN